MTKLAAFLVLCGLVVLGARMRRRRPAVERDVDPSEPQLSADHAAPPEELEPAKAQPASEPPPPPPSSKTCPVCLGEYPSSALFCPHDGAELVEPPGGPGTLVQGMICPTCRRGFASDNQFCPHDADELVPFGLFAANHAVDDSTPLPVSKICPQCGHRYATNHRFCREDGAQLVVVN